MQRKIILICYNRKISKYKNASRFIYSAPFKITLYWLFKVADNIFKIFEEQIVIGGG